jgi:isopenicillin-N N-acyltransferase-like protein
MSNPSRYPELVVSGNPREIGQQIGEALRETIRDFAAIALDRVNLSMTVSRENAIRHAEECIARAEGYAPHMVDELRGMAEAAGLSLAEVMLLQIRNQLKPDAAGGCTSISLANVAGVGRVAAQNWDNDPLLDRFTVVLTRKPTGKPAFTTLTQAGLIAYIGVSEAGFGLCLNSLPAPSRRDGVPHYFTVRGIFEARSLEAVIHAVERAERAIPANILLTTPEGPADLEVTIDEVCVLRDPACVTHANHCLHPRLATINTQFGELIQSHSRQARIDELWTQARTGPVTLDTVKAMLGDRQGAPRSICRDPNDDAGTGYWSTVFSVIMEGETGRMHITRGQPNHHNYELYEPGW